MSDRDFNRRLWSRLHRLDARLTSGFAQLGADLSNTIDHVNGTDDDKTLSDVWSRLSRVETRLVNGFRSLGVDPCVKAPSGDMVIDIRTMTITVASLNLTIESILRRLDKVCAPHGVYTVVCVTDHQTFSFNYRMNP